MSWRLPRQELEEGSAAVETQGSRSVLRLFNVTWRNSGRYACEESASDQIREMDIFVPGRGERRICRLSRTIVSLRPHSPLPSGPDEWFVPVGSGVVMKDGEEATIPCAVSDPLLNVSLYRRGDKTPAWGPAYEPGRGFTGRLNDSSYVCVASSGSEETRSQVYYVFSVVGEFRHRARRPWGGACPRLTDMSASRQGDGGGLDGIRQRAEARTTAARQLHRPTRRHGLLLLDVPAERGTAPPTSPAGSLDWTASESTDWRLGFRRPVLCAFVSMFQEFESLTEYLPDRIRSFVNIPSATLADSGRCCRRRCRRRRSSSTTLTARCRPCFLQAYMRARSRKVCRGGAWKRTSPSSYWVSTRTRTHAKNDDNAHSHTHAH